MKKRIIGLTAASCILVYQAALATPVVGKAILQNTTSHDLDIYYSLCTTYVGINMRQVCGFPLKLHLPANTSNSQNPLSITLNNKWGNGTFEIMQINDLKTGTKEKLGGSCQVNTYSPYNLLGTITFSTIVDNANIINCTSGSAKK